MVFSSVVGGSLVVATVVLSEISLKNQSSRVGLIVKIRSCL